MKNIGGKSYLTIGEVAELIDRSAQTIKNWYKWAASTDTNSTAGLPPFRRDLDAKGTYHFEEAVIEDLKAFRDSISYGQMSEFNVSRWGKRGKEIEARKQEIEENVQNELSAGTVQ